MEKLIKIINKNLPDNAELVCHYTIVRKHKIFIAFYSGNGLARHRIATKKIELSFPAGFREIREAVRKIKNFNKKEVRK